MRQEDIVHRILCYMKTEIEKHGVNPERGSFHFYKGVELIEDQEIFEFRAKNKISKDDIIKALNFCLANKYIVGGSVSEKFMYLHLTELGIDKAIYISEKNLFFIVISHPLFNTLVSGIISFAVGYYLGGK